MGPFSQKLGSRVPKSTCPWRRAFWAFARACVLAFCGALATLTALPAFAQSALGARGETWPPIISQGVIASLSVCSHRGGLAEMNPNGVSDGRHDFDGDGLADQLITGLLCRVYGGRYPALTVMIDGPDGPLVGFSDVVEAFRVADGRAMQELEITRLQADCAAGLAACTVVLDPANFFVGPRVDPTFDSGALLSSSDPQVIEVPRAAIEAALAEQRAREMDERRRVLDVARATRFSARSGDVLGGLAGAPSDFAASSGAVDPAEPQAPSVIYPPIVLSILTRARQACGAGDVAFYSEDSAVLVGSLSNDGIDDYIIDFSRLECPRATAEFCNATGCEHRVLVSRGDEYDEVFSGPVREIAPLFDGSSGFVAELSGPACRNGQVSCARRYEIDARGRVRSFVQ